MSILYTLFDSGNPNKPIESMVQYRLRNNATGQTSVNKNTYFGYQNRGVDKHSAGGGYSQAVGSQSLPAGNYVLQAFGESNFGGCSSGGVILGLVVVYQLMAEAIL
jgi:hypothetical protein